MPRLADARAADPPRAAAPPAPRRPAPPDPVADLVLHHVSLVTLDPRRPRAQAVAVRRGRILAVGGDAEVRSLVGRRTPEVDGGGATLLPSFVDPHLHLLAWAAGLQSVDCRPAQAPDLDALCARIRARAATLAPGTWVRATGYDESALAERRHPTRHDLDRATTSHPVRLQHRSGHAWVLNTAALERLLALGADGLPLQRDAAGEPTGLLYEADRVLGRLGPGLTEAELLSGLEEVGRRLLAAGTTLVQDATPQPPASAALLRRLVDRLPAFPRLRAMLGVAELVASDERAPHPATRGPDTAAGAPDTAAEAVRADGREGARLAADGLKVVLHAADGQVGPSTDALVEALRLAHRTRRPLALHVVEEDALVLALDAVERARALGLTPRVRLEHVAVCPPDLAPRLAGAGVQVVTQPGFVHASGDRYRATIEPERQPWLYPAATLLRLGIPLAASSDAPFGPAEPLLGLAAAVTRRTASGAVLGPDERVDRQDAIGLLTRSAAAAAGVAWPGLQPGAPADLVLLDVDLDRLADDELRCARVRQTFLDGRPMLRRGPGG